MQTSRFFVSTLAIVGIVGLAGLTVAQTNTTIAPGATTTTPPMGIGNSQSEAARLERERMNRERLNRERLNRESMNAPAGSRGLDPRSSNAPMGIAPRRDANGNLTARADRN